ncbi:MAG TPA: serpin family protein [Patescibacteria group bacterium]|nr:serpin family protein [Patescibacteria group bacterium]
MKTLVAFSAFCIILATGCSGTSEPEAPPRALTTSELAVSTSAGTFGLELLKKLNNDEANRNTNMFISPLSIHMALGMALNGARGETHTEMTRSLGFSAMSQQEINSSAKSLKDLLTSMDRRVTLSIANSIWTREGFPVEQEFSDLNKRYYDAESASLDFLKGESSDIINSWVKGKTSGKIDGIVPKPLSPDAVMYLINAVYFKAPWKNRFKTEDTRDDMFMLADGSKAPCRMMTLTGSRFKMYSTMEVEALDLPYGNGRFGMTIILPRQGTLNECIDGLPALWPQITERLHERDVDVQIPKFTITYSQTLNPFLKMMGIQKAFIPDEADFAGISKGGGLYISNVAHKTFVTVNEEGTEAAAATSVEIGPVSAPKPFRADRPFVFVIRDYHSNTILFTGKVMKPEP